MDKKENGAAGLIKIGHVRSDVKVYMEQRAYELMESCRITDTRMHQIFYLLGREYHLGLQRVFVVRCILEGEMQDGKSVQVSPEALRSVEKQRESQHPGMRLIGWALNQPGFGVNALDRHERSHMQYFRQSSLLLLKDSLIGKSEFYLWSGSSFQSIGGFLLYREQDPPVDDSAEERPVELWDEPEDSMLQRALRDNPPSSAIERLLAKKRPESAEEPEKAEANTPSDESERLTGTDPEPSASARASSSAAAKELGEAYTAPRSYGRSVREPRRFEGFLRPINERPKPRSFSAPRFTQLVKDESSSPDGSGSATLSLLTSICAIVLLISILMGAMLFHNLSTLDAIQTHIETLGERISIMEEETDDISEPPEE